MKVEIVFDQKTKVSLLFDDIVKSTDYFKTDESNKISTYKIELSLNRKVKGTNSVDDIAKLKPESKI